MPTFKVLVIGREPAPTQPGALTPPTYPLAAFPQERMREVDVLWPSICPCCGEPVETSHNLQVSKFKQSWTGFSPSLSAAWDVPYCQRCCEHVALKQQRPTRSIIIEIATVITALVAAFSILPSNPILAGAVFIAIVLAGVYGNTRTLQKYERDVVRPAMGKSCAAPGPALTYQGWNDDRTWHAFLFNNRDYAHIFAELNHAKDIFQVK